MEDANLGRVVTLVVCDENEDVLGRSAPFRVDVPWWQEVDEIEAWRPGLTVLRLLGGSPLRASNFGGDVTYLAEATGDLTLGGLIGWDGTLTDDPKRMPWARAGGPTADLAWARATLGEDWATARTVHHRTWNLSSISELTANDDTAWLKCVPPFFAHEAAVLQALEPESVPRLIAADAHRMLLAPLPGHDGYEATVSEQLELVDVLVGLQVRTAASTPHLLAAGVPDARTFPLVAEVSDVIARRAADDSHLRRLVDEAPDRLDEVASCGLPDVLVHGDAHPGNARIGCRPFIWFDWGDARVGNPLLDLAVLERAPEEIRPTIETSWLEAWGDAVPGSDPERAWKLLRPYAVARLAVVYQTFLDAIEESERRYHAGDVMPALDAASRIVAAEST